VHLDMRGWFRVAEPAPLLPVLQEAVWNDQRLRIVYARDGGEQSERLIDPLGLVAKINTWYLVAGTDGGMRSFRVARVAEAEPTGERFERPAAFDLARYWAESASSFRRTLPSFAVDLALHPSLLGELAWAIRSTVAALEETAQLRGDGRLLLSVDFETLADARAFMLRWADKAEALAPQELRDSLHRWSRDVANLYGLSGPIG
jgi:predicted DNA-binding transcriptional regulator YafY